MNVQDYIVIGIIAAIVAGAVAYIIRAKKRGQKCIGCPYSQACANKNTCSCGDKNEEENAE